MFWDNTKSRIISAVIKAVRQHGPEGRRIQNISELVGLSPGALYRYFDGKGGLMIACFIYVDRQAAAIYDHIEFSAPALMADPMEVFKSLWAPFF